MAKPTDTPRVLAVAKGLELSSNGPAEPGPEHRLLDVFIGRWINDGRTVEDSGAPAVEIVTSDIYEWAPGGFVVVHSAYGRIGANDVGGVEVISYDPGTGTYRAEFFDNQGNTTVSELTVSRGVWTWRGARTRCTATFSDDGRTQTARHERSSDGTSWRPSMNVTLRKIP
jgi:hypothetical protein